ncbi:hypothetical protein E2C01_101065 [Portunus trituberculatus]|uniref:Uncharacterized protein n=1 Tax=Portunus trituberculatus TaxID=210409 RepID=A0A5B7KF59_PORTR|nr:hypothetical protein [Portunus trituberculatus]
MAAGVKSAGFGFRVLMSVTLTFH